jgi:hypothetical protein
MMKEVPAIKLPAVTWNSKLENRDITIGVTFT